MILELSSSGTASLFCLSRHPDILISPFSLRLNSILLITKNPSLHDRRTKIAKCMHSRYFCACFMSPPLHSLYRKLKFWSMINFIPAITIISYPVVIWRYIQSCWQGPPPPLIITTTAKLWLEKNMEGWVKWYLSPIFLLQKPLARWKVNPTITWLGEAPPIALPPLLHDFMSCPES